MAEVCLRWHCSNHSTGWYNVWHPLRYPPQPRTCYLRSLSDSCLKQGRNSAEIFNFRCVAGLSEASQLFIFVGADVREGFSRPLLTSLLDVSCSLKHSWRSTRARFCPDVLCVVLYFLPCPESSSVNWTIVRADLLTQGVLIFNIFLQ